MALLLFTFDISPLCDVAQTSDCGMHYLLFPFISPLCGVALTPDCGIIILAVSSRGVIQTLVWHQYYYYCGIVNLFATFRGVIFYTRLVHFFYFRIARPYFSACVHHRLVFTS